MPESGVSVSMASFATESEPVAVSWSPPVVFRTTPTLENIPAEIRLNIFGGLFKYDKAILLKVNDDGYIVSPQLQGLPAAMRLSSQVLLTSRWLHEEAFRVLYEVNRFKVKQADIPNLKGLKQDSRNWMEVLKIQCNKPPAPDPVAVRAPVLHHVHQHVHHHAHHAPLILHGPHQLHGPQHLHWLHYVPTPRPVTEEDTKLDLPIISKAMPYIKKLSIKTYTPTQLLIITLKLANSLPCSPIRDKWPELKIDVTLDPAADKLSPAHESLLRRRGHKLGSLPAVSEFGLSREMGDFDTITVKGRLSPRLFQLIEEHVGAFGDVHFQKEDFPFLDTMIGPLNSFRFIWQLDNSPPQIPREILDAILASNYQFTPRLSEEWLKKIEEAGYDVTPLRNRHTIT